MPRSRTIALKFGAGSPAPPPVSDDWRADPLMLPAPNKVIYGMYTSTGTSLNTLENQWGSPIDLTRVYTGGGGILSGMSAAQTHLNAGRVPAISINWKSEMKDYVNSHLNNIGGTGKTWMEFIGDGNFDGNATDGTVDISGGPSNVPGLRAVARKVKAYTAGLCPTNRVVMTPWHEMENTAESGFGTTKDSTGYGDFRAAWHRLKFIFDDEGVDNALWGFCGATGPGHWGSSLTDTGSTGFYPGHSYINWMMWDPYNKSGQVNCSGGKPTIGYNNAWRDFGPPGNRGDSGTHVLDANGQMSWWYGRFKVGGKKTLAEVTGSEGVYKPVILGETGTGEFDPNAPGDTSKRATHWWDNMADWLDDFHDVIKGMIYFNNQYNNVECPTYRPQGFPGRGTRSIWATIEEG